MRRIALTLLLALPPLAFAPAPFPKAERTRRESAEARLVRDYDRRLRELGVKWELVVKGDPHVRFEIHRPGEATTRGICFMRQGGLPGALEAILGFVQGQRNKG
jgi:hypothetical protein